MQEAVVTSLKLSGHVHNRPWQQIHTSFSWPLGVKLSEATHHINCFNRAFHFKKAEITSGLRQS